MESDLFHIASAHFSGRISESDQEYLNAWLSQSPENQKIFNELEHVWKLTGNLTGNLNPDVDAEWRTFVQKNRVSDPLLSEPVKRSLWNNPIWRVAAVLFPALLIVASLLFFFTKSSNSNDWIVITAGETKMEQTLSDGSKVWINRNSSISYPKSFKKNERMVKLTGEAFFKVTKNKGVFSIATGNSQIKVLGTEFNVRANVNESFTEVIVKEGKVLFASQHNNNTNVLLIAGEKGLLTANSNKIVREGISKNTNPYAWMTQKLVFENTSLSQIGSDISRYFNKTFKVDPSLQQNTFTGTFINPQLDEVMRVVCLSINCNYEIKGDTILVRAK